MSWVDIDSSTSTLGVALGRGFPGINDFALGYLSQRRCQDSLSPSRVQCEAATIGFLELVGFQSQLSELDA